MSAKKPDAEDHCNTETDEGTAAAIKKRSRRVSFAEITSVHVFDRDDEYETPPDPKPNPEHDDELEQFNRDLGFLSGDENLQDEEEDDDEDGDEVEAGRLFLRPVESPASTAGSATSNDEDNFFGPVSTSFIRPERLSDSGVSDSHDITMDSTAFSQHFRSLVKSDSEVDLKTPTGVHLYLEENTPRQNIIPGSNLGSSMLLNSAKKPMSASSTSAEKLSGGSDSNDMSLVEDNPKRYDYGRLSFGWDPLLIEGVKDLDTDKIVPVSNKKIITQLPIHPPSRISLSKRLRERMELNDSGDENLGPTDNDHMVVDMAPLANKSDDANGHRENTEPNHMRNENLGGGDSDHVMAEVAPFADKLDDAKDHKESMELNGTGGGKVGHRNTDPMMVEVAPLADKLVGANGDHISSPIHRLMSMSTDELNLSSDLLIKGMLSTGESDASEMRPKADSHVENSDTAATQESEEPQLDVILQQPNKSPLAISLPSLSKQRQTVFKDARVCNMFLTSTPQSHVFSETDGIGRRAETVPSVQKSISKLRMLDASPFASNLNVELNSMHLSSESLYRTPPCNTSLYRNKEDDEIKHMDASAAWRDQSRIVALGNKDMNTLSNMKLNRVPISESLMEGSYSTGPAGIAKYGTSTVPRSTEVLASEQSYDLAQVRSLVSQLTWSGKNTKMNVLALEDPTGRIAVTPVKDSFFTKIALDHDTPYVHSLEERVMKKSISEEFQGITSQDDESKNTIIDQGHNVDMRENVRNASLSTTIAKELDSVFMEISHTSSPVLEINHLKGSTGLQTSSLEIKHHDVQDETRLEGCSQPCLTNEESRCLILNENLKTEKGPVLKTDLTGECVKASCVSPPPSVDKKLLELSHQSPSRRGFYNTAHDDKLYSTALGKQLLPNANQLTYEYEDSSARKRIREDVTSGERVNMDEIGGLQRSPKVHKSVGHEFEVLLGHQNRSNVETFTVGHEPTLQHWTEVFSKFLAKKTLPPSTDKLNFQAIGVLEDRLVKLQRLQTYQMHHNVIRSQKSLEDRANLWHKSRTAETKTMLLRIMHEHAKLQIMRLKQERLQRNAQLLRHGIQESQLLKLNSLPHISAGCSRDANINGGHCRSINIRGREEEEVPGDKATELRQLRDTLESKLTSLTKSVHSSCKLEGILSHIDTVSAVNGYLKKKICCKFLSSNAQLWKVHNILTMNGNRSLILNYLDFVIKRITVKAGSASSVVVSNDLNDGTMLKSFPNMEASTALSFAFNTVATQKYFGSPSLTQEIQITNSVLGNLVDVAEEVQQAHLELQNLTCTRFVSPSAGQLDLNFHFIGMKSGRKVALTLDMSCLKWGIYPSDIMPYKLEASSKLSQESLPEQLSAEIRAAVQSLSVGYWRILRMCTTVSQVVQAWSG